MKALDNELELGAFLQAFLDGALPKADWTHQAHIVMAACMILDHPDEEATARIREGIRSYNVASGGANTGTSGYHETVTIFWIRTITAALAELDPALSRLEKVRAISDRFAPHRDLFRSYWSYDIVQSAEARRTWVPPDAWTP